MTSAINFEDVSVKRGRNQVLENLNLNIQPGQIVGLLGPSGAGKTTIMRAIVNVQSGLKGKVEVLGHPAGAGATLRSVAYDTQASSVFDDLTIAQNLKFACQILGLSASAAEKALEDVGLHSMGKRKVSSLSGGQRSRVSLAMALLASPDLIVLDEPTVGLDPVLRAELWDIFRQLANQGKTLLVSSHVMDEAERCDQLIFVRDGKIIAFDTLPKILAQTKTSSAEEAFLALARKSSDA